MHRGFLRGGARPPTAQMIASIDQHKGRYGVEPIGRVLPIAPSSYYQHTKGPRSARAVRDAQLKVLLIQRRQGRDEDWLGRSLWGEVAEEPGGGDATVHEHVAAGDEGTVGAHEERGHGRDLVRGAAAPHRGQLDHAPVSSPRGPVSS